MTHGTNPKSPKFFIKLGILIGFIVEVLNTIFYSMTEAQLQQQIGKKDSIRKQLREIFNITDLFVEERDKWRKFYQKHFMLELIFTDLVIPEMPQEGDWRLIIVAQGLTLNQVYDAMSKAFKCWRYVDDLDASVTKNARDTKATYAIWVRNGIEPDTKYLGKSTNEADSNMKIGVTLLERMLHEMVYFDETGNHLDVKGLTFCTGSRNSDGSVVGVGWYSVDREVQVDWFRLDDSDSGYGLREAVS